MGLPVYPHAMSMLLSLPAEVVVVCQCDPYIAADSHGHLCELLLLRLYSGQDPISFKPFLQAHATGAASESQPSEWIQ